MSPKEYAHRAIADLIGRQPSEVAVEKIARAIAEAVAEEREACALIADSSAEAWFGQDDGEQAASGIAKAIRERAGAAMAERRASC